MYNPTTGRALLTLNTAVIVGFVGYVRRYGERLCYPVRRVTPTPKIIARLPLIDSALASHLTLLTVRTSRSFPPISSLASGADEARCGAPQVPAAGHSLLAIRLIAAH